MGKCKKTLKPKPIGTDVLASNVIWNAGMLCFMEAIADGKSITEIIQELGNAHCELQEAFDGLIIPPAAEVPVLEEVVLTNINGVLLDADVNFVSDTYFQFAGLGYESLEYTNNSGSTKTYIIDARANIGTSATAPSYGFSDVDMAIFTRVSGPIESQISEVLGQNQINFLGDGININPEWVINGVYVYQALISDLAEVTLQDGETVLLKFKSKGGASGFLNKAILHVREKHN